MPKARPLGYKAAAEVRKAAHLTRQAITLIEQARRNRDRRPDQADEQMRDAVMYSSLAEGIMLRLQLGQFEDGGEDESMKW